MAIMLCTDELSDEMQSKLIQSRNFSQLDTSNQLQLWQETFIVRRKAIRDQSRSDVMKNFPAYSNALLVFDEVKTLTNIDLSKEVRRQVPVVLDKLVETPAFIADSPPIRLIKILCRKFGETIQHILCDKERPTPYPILVDIDDTIHIYVDLDPILATSSPDDALGLLIAMYSIFELSFDKKSRTIRFLYCPLHGDKQFLFNSIRVLIKEKNIDIHRERLQLTSSSSDSVSNNTTSLTSQSQSRLKIVANILDQSTSEHNSSIIYQPAEPTTSTDSSYSSAVLACDTNAYNNNHENMSPSDSGSQLQTRKKRKLKQNSNEEEEKNDTSMKNNPREKIGSSQSRLPLATLTNSTVVLRQTKRKRQA